MPTTAAMRWRGIAGLLLVLVSTGCAAFRPIYGVPARYMPDEFRGATRSGKRTIDLSLLRQPPPPKHLVDTDDLLSIYVEGVLGNRNEQPPVYFPQNSDTPPTVGYPIPVRDDGTISMPLVGAIPVRGLSIREVEDAIRQAYTVTQQLLQPGRDRIFVALQQPRTYRVLVIRQEASSDVSIGAQGQLNIGALKRGTGQVVNLPVYKNDVLNALAETGGLPGLDAENAIYVIRRRGAQPIHPAGSHYPPAPAPTTSPTPIHRPPASALHPQDTIIRGQSPVGPTPVRIAAAGDYRSGGGAVGGWSRPSTVGSRYAPAITTPARAQIPVDVSRGSAQPVASPHETYNQNAASSHAVPNQGDSSWLPVGYGSGVPQHDPASPPLPAPGAWAGQQWNSNPVGYGDGTGLPSMGPDTSWDNSMATPNMVGNWPVDLGTDLNDRHIVRIPIRLGPGEYANIQESDILLYDGDIVFIESRDTEVFYTGGLLGGGQYTLPRDYDLDVLGAIAVAQGQRGGGGGSSRATQSQGGQSALNSDVSISASQLIVLRPLPDGTQLTIQVDLYEAIRNPNERIIIQPGDYLLLQYTRCEAVMAFVERHLLEGALFGVAAAQLNQGN